MAHFFCKCSCEQLLNKCIHIQLDKWSPLGSTCSTSSSSVLLHLKGKVLSIFVTCGMQEGQRNDPLLVMQSKDNSEHLAHATLHLFKNRARQLGGWSRVLAGRGFWVHLSAPILLLGSTLSMAVSPVCPHLSSLYSGAAIFYPSSFTVH